MGRSDAAATASPNWKGLKMGMFNDPKEEADYAEMYLRNHNSPREAVEQHRESLYPPLPPAELADAHGFENLTRVVVAQHGVYGRRDGNWFQLVPLSEMYKSAEQKTSAKFKAGDIVVLRSGGPQMTVFRMQERTSRCSLVDTEWFVGGVLSRDTFSEAELEHAPPKETPKGGA